MERICILGCSGAGKSTLARQLGTLLDLKVIHLDLHFWHPGWVESEETAWRAIQEELIKAPRWVIDGNYSATWDIRINAADTLIYLDMPRWLCLWRVFKRVVKHYGRHRADIPEGCPERFSWEFEKYIWNYRRTRRPKTLARLDACRQSHTIIHIQNPRELRDFVAKLETSV